MGSTKLDTGHWIVCAVLHIKIVTEIWRKICPFHSFYGSGLAYLLIISVNFAAVKQSGSYAICCMPASKKDNK